MADNEKNMARLIKWCNEACEGCGECCDDCSINAVKSLLVYSHNQKTEIERLNEVNEELDKENDAYVDLLSERCDESVSLHSANAIKRFAKRLCENRKSDDPVVIAVNVELKRIEEND